MATRREVEKRKRNLRDLLEQECRAGAFRPHSLLPPVRELAATHELSPLVVRQVLQSLEAEGLLYTVPRVGTFAGQHVAAECEFYLLLLPTVIEGPFVQLKIGFEERIARLGGASLLLTPDAALQYAHSSHLPRLAGVFDFDEAPFSDRSEKEDLPHVRFAGSKHPIVGADLVSFDDENGGRLAAQHLLAMGHRRIAFLGLHRAEIEGGMFAWSAERERGWREALIAQGFGAEGLAYHVTESGDFDQVQAARAAAGPLVRRPDITAVVTANDLAAKGLLEAFQDAATPSEYWPAIVGFDEDPTLTGYNLSSCRLPWDEVGRVAADLLWQRRHGRLTGPPVHRQIAMQLIQRITCRANWSLSAQPAALAARNTPTQALSGPP